MNEEIVHLQKGPYGIYICCGVHFYGQNPNQRKFFYASLDVFKEVNCKKCKKTKIYKNRLAELTAEKLLK